MIDAIFNVLKITVIIALALVFMTAIMNFLYLLNAITFGGIVGEVFSLASMYLPFDAGTVFGGIGTAMVGILSFYTAKKIFDLTSWGINSI